MAGSTRAPIRHEQHVSRPMVSPPPHGAAGGFQRGVQSTWEDCHAGKKAEDDAGGEEIRRVKPRRTHQ